MESGLDDIFDCWSDVGKGLNRILDGFVVHGALLYPYICMLYGPLINAGQFVVEL